MKRVLMSMIVLSALLVYSPARAEVSSGRVFILNHTYLPGNCSGSPAAGSCAETLPDDPSGQKITQITMTSGASIQFMNLEPGIDTCSPGDRANCHTITSDQMVGSDPLFESTFPISATSSMPFIPPGGNTANFDRNGTLFAGSSYTFHCRVHSNMHGVLHVIKASCPVPGSPTC